MVPDCSHRPDLRHMESGTGDGGYDTALEERDQTAARKASPNEDERVGLCTPVGPSSRRPHRGAGRGTMLRTRKPVKPGSGQDLVS